MALDKVIIPTPSSAEDVCVVRPQVCKPHGHYGQKKTRKESVSSSVLIWAQGSLLYVCMCIYVYICIYLSISNLYNLYLYIYVNVYAYI